jgi:hypothetical protein
MYHMAGSEMLYATFLSIIYSQKLCCFLLIVFFLMSLHCISYCMRVMMEDVPDSEWLCEDCQAAVEFEKKELEKCEMEVGT